MNRFRRNKMLPRDTERVELRSVDYAARVRAGIWGRQQALHASDMNKGCCGLGPASDGSCGHAAQWWHRVRLLHFLSVAV